MSQPVPPPAAAATKPRPRRWLRRTLWIASSFVVLLFGAWLVFQLLGGSRLERARADADRLDPGWRWDELRGQRSPIADADNSALTLEKMYALLGTSWDGPLNATPPPEEGKVGVSIAERMGQVPSNERLPEDVIAALRQTLAAHDDARALARQLAEQPRGRMLVPAHVDYLVAVMPRIQESRNVANFLRHEAQLRLHDSDITGALLMNRCLVNAGGSLHDEPTLIAQLVRIALDAIAVHNLERMLGQVEAPAADLAKLQEPYEQELQDQALLCALRGERAFMDKSGFTVGLPGGFRPQNFGGFYESNCATILEFMNRGVELAKLPTEEQREGFIGWERDVKRMAGSQYSRWMNYYALMTLPAIEKVAEADFRRRANLGCALLVLAAERYRLQHGKWPEKIEDLEPFVKKLPNDPFGKGPLKLKRTPDGLIIYSVGYDGLDNQGSLNRAMPMAKGVDIGLQLWDVAKRGLPAKPTE